MKIALPIAAPRGGPSGPAPDEPSECARLLERMATRHDREAFAALFRRYAPRLRQHLQGRGLSDAVADELVQEVMLRVWRKADTFDPARGSPGAWIFAIARACLIDELRRRRRSQGAPVVPDEAATLPEEVGDSRTLRHALGTLPPEQAEVLWQAYYRGLSLAEVAAVHDLPLGTVKTRARLALSRLRELFAIGRSP